jgi:hypothetical protein
MVARFGNLAKPTGFGYILYRTSQLKARELLEKYQRIQTTPMTGEIVA